MLGTPKTPPLPFIRGLRLIGDSLTHLDISKGPGLQLCDIMEACPNLLFLKADNVNAIMPLPSSSSYSLLQYLSLDRQRQQTLEHEDMVDFLRRFPSLRTLQISPMPNTTVLPILHKHCPYLHEISLGHPSPNLGVLSANDHSNRKGIRSAYLGGERSYCRDSLIEFLYAQRDSLETFNFYGEHKIENASWKLSADGRIENDPLSPFSLTRLVHLEFKEFDPYQNMSMMKWIVLNAPNLNAIEIFNVHFTRDIAKTLIKSQHLRKVQVDHNFEKAMEDSFIDNSDRGIHQFFEDHAALGDRSTLEHMAVEMALMDEFEHRWVDLLSRLPCLKVLELHHPYSHADYAMANRFKAVVERICRKCPALEKLTINGECRDGWRSDEASDSPSSSRSSWSSYESYMDYY